MDGGRLVWVGVGVSDVFLCVTVFEIVVIVLVMVLVVE